MLVRRVSPEGVVFYASPLLSGIGVPHAFSTRIGGISPAPFDSLNLGNPADADPRDPPARIRENGRRLLRAAGSGEREMLQVHQVHGRVVALARANEPFDGDQKADAIVCNDPSRAAAVRVADCVPVLLALADGSAVAAVHAGWRGTAAGVAGAAVEMLGRVGSGGRILAAIGPAISAEAFEVGPEVAAVFDAIHGGAGVASRLGSGKALIDLRLVLRLQLVSAGVAEGDIDLSDRCTFRDSEEFFSHRRDAARAGRMMAVIGANA